MVLIRGLTILKGLTFLILMAMSVKMLTCTPEASAVIQRPIGAKKFRIMIARMMTTIVIMAGIMIYTPFPVLGNIIHESIVY